MCGRYELKASAKSLIAHFQGLRLATKEVQQRGEIFPSDSVLMLFGGEQGIQALQARWGLVGSFLDVPPKNVLINLRSEGIPNKPFYGRLLRHRRCILPATAYFEWQVHAGGGKQKFRISNSIGKPLWIAGIYDHHPAVGVSCAMLTTDANDRIGGIHSRMPVILSGEKVDWWLAEHEELPEDEFGALINSVAQCDLKAELALEPEPSPQLAFEFA